MRWVVVVALFSIMLSGCAIRLKSDIEISLVGKKGVRETVVGNESRISSSMEKVVLPPSTAQKDPCSDCEDSTPAGTAVLEGTTEVETQEKLEVPK